MNVMATYLIETCHFTSVVHKKNNCNKRYSLEATRIIWTLDLSVQDKVLLLVNLEGCLSCTKHFPLKAMTLFFCHCSMLVHFSALCNYLSCLSPSFKIIYQLRLKFTSTHDYHRFAHSLLAFHALIVICSKVARSPHFWHFFRKEFTDR